MDNAPVLSARLNLCERRVGWFIIISLKKSGVALNSWWFSLWAPLFNFLSPLSLL